MQEDKKPSQKFLLKQLLSDGEWHSTVEICEKVYGNSHLGLSRVGARIWDLKQDGCEIEPKRDEEKRTLYWYRMLIKPVLFTNLRPEVVKRLQKEKQMSLI